MVLDNKVENLDVNIIPESAGEGIGDGVRTFGQGLGHFFACLGDRIKYGTIPYEKTEKLITEASSRIIQVAKNYNEKLSNPNSLFGSINYQEEKNLRNFIKYTVEEMLNREKKGEPLPEKLEDTDNLLAIEKASSETSDEDLLKMWAKIFVEESTNKNSINKRAINLLKILDKDTIEFLQNDIFKFCDDSLGWFFNDKNVNARMKAIDLGIIENYSIQSIPVQTFKKILNIPCIYLKIDNNVIIGHPGYSFITDYHLTDIGFKIKTISNIKFDKRNIEHTIQYIKENSCFRLYERNFEYTRKNRSNDDFIIMAKDSIIYSQDKYENILDYLKKSSSYISYKNNID